MYINISNRNRRGSRDSSGQGVVLGIGEDSWAISKDVQGQ